MKLLRLIGNLTENKIYLSVREGKLVISSPVKDINHDLIEQIKKYKSSLK